MSRVIATPNYNRMNKVATSVVFDEHNFLANFQGMEDLAQQTIHSFLQSLPQQLQAIESAILAQNSEELELAAHSLKGSASNFCSESVQQLAFQLEKMGRAKATTECEQIFKKLQIQSELLTRSLQEFLQKRTVA